MSIFINVVAAAAKAVAFAGLFVLLFAAATSPAHAEVPSPATAPPPWEISFSLPAVTGNPFDYRENDVQAVLHLPGGKTENALAFFDGEQTWRVRFAVSAPGNYELVRVLRNGAPVVTQSILNGSITVAKGGKKAPGFVRLDPKNKTRFAFDDGTPYYPVGNNVAWRSGSRPDVSELFAKMGAAHENWARVWMNHWDGKNLDWPRPENTPPGTLNLEAARRWDGIVRAAEENGIYFQMTLQHHGQYSSRVNPNWPDNPWNAANPGGFLKTPEAFFTSDRARELTRAKYRYIVARWGYSPHILAWELFNEVQFTDAIQNKHPETVAAWHKEMADFLRSVDANHHLITTSSDTDIPHLYDAVDYVQPHSYPNDGVQTVLSVNPAEWNKPLFYGEIGPPDARDTTRGAFLHQILWASLVSSQSGTAQYWSWDEMEQNNLWGAYQSVTGFLALPNALSVVRDLPAGRAVSVQTTELSPVSFGPGGGWGKSEQTAFVVEPSGTVAGAGKMPSFLQGKNHADLFTHAEFSVDFPQTGTFSVAIRQSAKAGAHLVVSVDGQKAGEQDFPAADTDQTVQSEPLHVSVPMGKHVVRIENSGADWVVLQKIMLSPYGPGLRVLAKGDDKRMVLWAYRPAAAPDATGITGTITLPGVVPGKYRVQWWNTGDGKPLIPAQTVTVGKDKTLTLHTPAIAEDCAALIVPTAR